MRRLLIVLVMLPTMLVGYKQAFAAKAYVVNSDTVYANLTFDRQWIDLLKNQMGYTVKVITDDSASHITTPTAAYDGYFLSATINGANLSNLDTTASGVVICDQLLYDDFRVASGQVNPANYSTPWNLARVDSTHAVTKYMSGNMSFQYSAGTATCPYVGIPSGASVWFTLSNRNWDGSSGDPNDTSFCYGIDVGGTMASGAVASGRRAVATIFYGLLTTQTDAGWCHPYELFGNICGWAFGDEENQFNANYNCLSNDNQTTPGPEVRQAWSEYPNTDHRIYAGGRTGPDNGTGLMFLNFPYWNYKVMPGYEPDSLKFTYKIGYRGFGSDNPPHLYDTVSIVSVNSTTSMTIDTTTRNLSTVSTYDWFFQGSQGYCIVLRSGAGADTTQKGDTCRLSAPSSGSNSSAVTYTIGATSSNNSGIWNGTAGGQMILKVADPYGGFDFWLKAYRIIPTTPWTTPLASLSQGGNPEGSSTVSWANRYYLKSGNSGQVAWSATNLVAGVDYEATPTDSFRFNKSTFAPDGTASVEFVFPGSDFNDPDFNGYVLKTTDLTTGDDSVDIEIIPGSIATVRGTRTQKFEMYLSDASPQTLGVEDTTYTLTGVWGEFANGFNYNTVVNTGDGVIAIDSVVDDASWLFLSNTSGSTPLSVLHVIDTTGLAVGSDTATVLVYASGADNTPLTYYVIYVLTAPPVETPAATVEKRTGLRLQ